MSIEFREKTKTFFLDGKDMTYAFSINDGGYLCHLYYGSPIAHDELGFSIALYGRTSTEATMPGNDDRSLSYTRFLPEISFFGTGDYREPTVHIKNPDGDRLCDLLYVSHEILPSKPPISGMPSLNGGETLVVYLKDKFSGFGAELYYTVFDDVSVIARRVVFVNGDTRTRYLERAYSFATGFYGNDFDVMTLYGAWACERNIQTTPVAYGVVSVDSKRCASSATLNPFMGLIPHGTTESFGDAYGVSLLYSSSFVLKAEGAFTGDTLLTGGINDFDFSWRLDAGERFETPEVVLAYSSEGIGGLSRTLHDTFREHLIDPKWVYEPRPIVINNWEATYFNFDNDKLKAMADAVEGTGIDTLVLDDGWFGKRDNDKSGLGDWSVNTRKLEGGLTAIIDYVHQKGMKFGLWFEPEMVSEDSELFRAHPDYAIGVPNRPRCYSRHQFMLDLTRKEVRDYIVAAVNRVLNDYSIDYVKWDYNRSVTDAYSVGRESDRQTEFAHRYALGLYDLCERIVKANPNVFFEGCAGGGGRFDPAMLYYFPQIWTSDDSDAEERTKIQYGTSIVYPLSSMSCHVSAVPNHQTGRTTKMKTRADIAHLGATGYELDTSLFTEDDRATVKAQTAEYKKYEQLILRGDLYRTENPFEGNYFGETVVAKDKSCAVLCFYRRSAVPNAIQERIRFAGLDKEKLYRVEGLSVTAHGSTLMNVGIAVENEKCDFVSHMLYAYEV